VLEEYRSGLNHEYQALLAFQSGVDREEDKKEVSSAAAEFWLKRTPTVLNPGHVLVSDEKRNIFDASSITRVILQTKRQKQYLRHRRLFMDIEREQVKEQNRQREQKKRIEKIKKRKEQQRYAEEQRLLRAHCCEEPSSEEQMSEVLAQLQLEEIKGAREKQHRREKEYVRYVEALRAQVKEKMKLYNITLPPLCCCGPDFWDAHPDTCANNCIFYKNYRGEHRNRMKITGRLELFTCEVMITAIPTLQTAVRFKWRVFGWAPDLPSAQKQLRY
ncbi:hypothetical protein STEG23_036203, partial [Scotinomys teguina]